LEDISINGRVAAFRMNFKGIVYEGVDWIELAQHRERRRAFVNTAVNLRVQMRAISWLAHDLFTSQEELCPWRQYRWTLSPVENGTTIPLLYSPYPGVSGKRDGQCISGMMELLTYF
jgi:hypothetical protein